jgi:septal ring factor EnvC (AmiA/AmiB activator)
MARFRTPQRLRGGRLRLGLRGLGLRRRELRETQAKLESDAQQLAPERAERSRRERELTSAEVEVSRQEQQIAASPALARAVRDLSVRQERLERSAAGLRDQLSAARDELASARRREEAKLAAACADLRRETATSRRCGRGRRT